MSGHPQFYRRPPVIERVLRVQAEVSEDVYQKNRSEWEAKVLSEFPVSEPLAEWRVDIQQRPPGDSTVRILGTPELHIIPRFSKKKSEEGFDWSIRCPKGILIMNMHSQPNEGAERRYLNLRREYCRWLTEWLRIFDITETTTASIYYINMLSKETIPSFYQDDRLELPEVLNIFSQIPGEHKMLLPPYQCTATMLLNGRENSTLQVIVNDSPNAQMEARIRVDFIATTPLKDTGPDADAIAELLDWCHERVIDRFEAVFTDKAKKAFQPVN